MGKYRSYFRRGTAIAALAAPSPPPPAPTLLELYCDFGHPHVVWATDTDPYQLCVERTPDMEIPFAEIARVPSPDGSYDDEEATCPTTGMLIYRLRFFDGSQYGEYSDMLDLEAHV